MSLINRSNQFILKRPAALLLRLIGTGLMLLSLSHCAQLSDKPLTQANQTSQPEQTEQLDQTEQLQAGSEAAKPVSEASATEPAQQGLRQNPKDEANNVVVVPLTPVQLSRFQQAKQLMLANKFDQAHTLLKPLASAVPQAAGIGYNLAVCLWQLQQHDQAQQQLNRLLEQQPDYVEAVNLLGVIARHNGNFNQAKRYWLDAVAQQQNFAPAHKNLGFLYELYLAQPEQARYHYQQYQQLTGDPMAEAWLSLLEQQQE